MRAGAAGGARAFLQSRGKFNLTAGKPNHQQRRLRQQQHCATVSQINKQQSKIRKSRRERV